MLALPVVSLGVLPVQSDRPLRMTTEGAEYCQVLSARLAASPRAAEDEPRGLGEEGRRLCSLGHYRTGIAKLRRALRAAQSAVR